MLIHDNENSTIAVPGTRIKFEDLASEQESDDWFAGVMLDELASCNSTEDIVEAVDSDESWQPGDLGPTKVHTLRRGDQEYQRGDVLMLNTPVIQFLLDTPFGRAFPSLVFAVGECIHAKGKTRFFDLRGKLEDKIQAQKEDEENPLTNRDLQMLARYLAKMEAKVFSNTSFGNRAHKHNAFVLNAVLRHTEKGKMDHAEKVKRVEAKKERKRRIRQGTRFEPAS